MIGLSADDVALLTAPPDACSADFVLSLTCTLHGNSYRIES